jgi:hypothetical protein
VIFTAINGSAEREMEEEDCAEVILYEEFQDRNPLHPSLKKRMRMMMHYDVSSNPFFASVRLHSHSRGQTPLRTRANTEWSEARSTTPGSFPPSPKLRAVCLGRSYDKVNNVIYTARDKLRLEARRSNSNDFTRLPVSRLITNEKFGTYDPFHTAQNIRLTNGNHCARRLSINHSSPNSEPTSSMASCSTRSALSIMRNAYVYIEYFVKATRSPTASSSTHDQRNSFSSSTPFDELPPMDAHSDLLPLDSPTRRANDNEAGVCLGIAACDFPLHGGVPVGLSDKSVSISLNGFVNVSSGPTQIPDDSEHGNTFDYFVKSYPIQAQVSSGDRIGMLLFFSSPSLDHELLGPVAQHPVTRLEEMDIPQEDEHPQPCASWDSMGLPYDDHEKSHPMSEGETFEIVFNLNGYPIELPWEARNHLADIVWGESSFYPTVSFLDPGMSVWSGYCSDDVVHRDRKSIGAPEGVVVYCLDGSVLLEKDE